MKPVMDVIDTDLQKELDVVNKYQTSLLDLYGDTKLKLIALYQRWIDQAIASYDKEIAILSIECENDRQAIFNRYAIDLN